MFSSRTWAGSRPSAWLGRVSSRFDGVEVLAVEGSGGSSLHTYSSVAVAVLALACCQVTRGERGASSSLSSCDSTVPLNAPLPLTLSSPSFLTRPVCNSLGCVLFALIHAAVFHCFCRCQGCNLGSRCLLPHRFPPQPPPPFLLCSFSLSAAPPPPPPPLST